jgi:hypothetical protein
MVVRNIGRRAIHYTYNNTSKERDCAMHVFFFMGLCLFLLEFLYLTYTGQKSVYGSRGTKTLLFAAEVSSTLSSPRIQLCMNAVYHHAGNSSVAIATVVSNFRHDDPYFQSATRLGLATDRWLNTLNDMPIPLILIANYDPQYDARAEVAYAKMSRWSHICFVKSPVPLWAMERAGSGAYSIMSVFAWGLSTYDTVIMVPPSSAFVIDAAQVVFDWLQLSGVPRSRGSGAVILARPQPDIFSNIAHLAVQHFNDYTDWVHQLHLATGMDTAHQLSGVCDMNINASYSIETALQRHDCSVVVFASPIYDLDGSCASLSHRSTLCDLWKIA